jgi:SET domain-containing protein
MSSVITLPTDPLKVLDSPIHGLGVFSTRPVATGDVLGVYVGCRYPAGAEVEVAGDGSVTYLFGLSDGTTVDGGQGGNETKYLNHSCEPNCEAVEEWGDDDQIILKIVATRDIRAGQEVFIDYALMLEAEDDDPYRCLCGTRTCRGSMASRAT